MSETGQKFRAIFLAALMIFSVFGGTVALGGAAAANTPGEGSYAAGNFTGDNGQTVNALSGENTEIVDLDFSSDPGEIDNVTVNASFGTDAANVSAADIDSVTVIASNGSEVISEQTTSYDQSGVTVDFNGTAADETGGVDRVRVVATLSSSATLDGDEVIDAGVEIFADDGSSFGGSSPYDTAGTQSVTTTSGFISGEVEDTNGDPIENAIVEIVNEDSGATAATLTTDADGEFDPSRVRVAPGNNYTVNVNQFGFTSFSQTQLVEDGDTLFFPVTLDFNLSPDTLRVESFDGNEVTGTSSTLFADGQSSNSQQYVAILENSSVESTATPNDASSFVGEDIDLIFNDTAGVGDFVDNDASNNSLTVTTDEVADIDDDGFEETYVVFEVTADNASSDSLGTPLVEEQINATYENLNNNSATVQYVKEGDEAIIGNIVDSNGDPINGATVWAAYDGTNASLEFTENTFVNSENETFLVDETNEAGLYAIPGLAGDNTNVTLYVDADGFNRFNETGSTVGQFVAAADAEQTAGPDAGNENHDFRLTEVDVDIVDYQFNVTVADSEGTLVKETSVPTDQERNVRVEVDQLRSTSAEYGPASNQEITVDLTEATAGQLGETTLTTDSDGVATTTFTAGLTADTTNVTASATNASGTQFDATGSEQANVTVFETGEVTGNVLTDDNQLLPGAMIRVTDLTTGAVVANLTASSEGLYTLTGLKSNTEYRIAATFDGKTGITTVEAQPGTVTADVVIPGVEPPAPETSVISGQIINATDENLPGAIVEITKANTGTVVASVKSDSQGQYSVTGLEPGTVYDITAMFGGETGTGTIEAQPGTNTRDVVIEGAKSPASGSFDVELTRNGFTVEEGETLTISPEITNTGNASATQSVKFELVTAGRTYTVTRNISLAERESTSEEVTFNTNQGDVGEALLLVESENGRNDSIPGEIVEPDDSEDVAKFRVDIVETNAPIAEGNILKVRTVVENTGSDTQTAFVGLMIADNVVSTKEVSLDGGERTQISLLYSSDDSYTGQTNIKVLTDHDEDATSVLIEPDGPSVSDYTTDQGIVTSDGLRDAFADWQAGDIESPLLRDVFAAWQSADPVGS